MQARNQALTPEERKARSAKAAAASAEAAKRRKAVGPFPQGANRAPQPPAPQTRDLPVVAYVYTSTWKRPDTGVEALVHTPVEAQTPRRALKLGRRLAAALAPEGTSFGGFVALARADSLDFAPQAR
jgi:hypothetical protein